MAVIAGPKQQHYVLQTLILMTENKAGSFRESMVEI